MRGWKAISELVQGRLKVSPGTIRPVVLDLFAHQAELVEFAHDELRRVGVRRELQSEFPGQRALAPSHNKISLQHCYKTEKRTLLTLLGKSR